MEIGTEVLGKHCHLPRSVASASGYSRLLRLIPGGWPLAFVAAFCCVCTASQYLAFGVILNDFRTFYNCSQSSVETILSLNLLGLGSTLPAGLFVRRWGIRAGQVVTLVIATLATFFIWSATWSPNYYSPRWALQGLYFLLAGCGSGCSIMVALVTMTQNAAASKRWLVGGVSAAGYNLGALFFICVYNGRYSSSATGGQPNLGSYYLLVLFLTFFSNLLGVLVYGNYRAAGDNEHNCLIRSESQNSVDSSYSDASSIMQPVGISRLKYDANPEDPNIPTRKLLRNSVFNMLAWPCILMVSLNLMNWCNLSTYLTSVGRDRHTWGLSLVPLFIGLVAKWTFVCTSENYRIKVPRAWFILIACGCTILTYVFAIFLLNSGVILYILYITWSLCSVSVSANTHDILVEEFGQESYPRNAGIVMCATALAASIFTSMLGLIYDRHADDSSLSGPYCYGNYCFLGMFFIAGLLSILSFVLTGSYILRRLNRRTIFSMQYEPMVSDVEMEAGAEEDGEEDLLYLSS